MRFPSRFGPAKVSAAVFANEPCQAWAKRSRPGSNSRRCRDEAAQSDVGISAYCRTGESCLRHLYLTRIMKDSLWSLDLVRCESVALRTFWVLVVMDQWTRRIVGFGIQPGIVDGPTLCRMFKQAIRGSASEVSEFRSRSVVSVSSVASEPASSRRQGNQTGSQCSPLPSVHRAIGRDNSASCLGQSLFWTAADLELKLSAFKSYYNGYRTHQS